MNPVLQKREDLSDGKNAELGEIAARYARRRKQVPTGRYSWLNPGMYLPALEREKALLELFREVGLLNLEQVTLLEVGCGSGGNLLRFIHWGFDPANLVGNELLDARLAQARKRLPLATRVVPGDASTLDCGSFDIVFQSTVFSSILDDDLQQRLAARMWDMTRPGGAILWYDFCYDNPHNADVRGVPHRRIRELFPQGELQFRRITLAPPLTRWTSRISTRIYPLLSAMPFLCTHALCWIPKPRLQMSTGEFSQKG
jgi:SAM-dependent methyltransferase